MSEDDIKVVVVKYPDRTNLMMRYADPLTGKQTARSTGTTNRRQAERCAAKWEAELREGRYKSPSKITWEEFRNRYETEYLSGLASETLRKVQGVFNTVEEIICPTRLRDLTESRISHYQSELRKSRSEDTIAGHLAHLKAALNWAVRMKLLAVAPVIQKPPRAKGGKAMKGRPITGEELERMLAKTPSVVGDAATADWRRFLRGIWLSGLRLSEAMVLSWDDDAWLQVILSEKFPMMRIPAELEKGNKDRLLPIVPDFAELLLLTPEAERTGFVFHPRGRKEVRRLSGDWSGRLISEIGEAAKVKVNTDQRTKKIKFASAHDLRRSFGERWAMKVMPHVLKELMRHETIETTMKYYVGRNAQAVADSLWANNPPEGSGNTFGNNGPNRRSPT